MVIKNTNQEVDRKKWEKGWSYAFRNVDKVEGVTVKNERTGEVRTIELGGILEAENPCDWREVVR